MLNKDKVERGTRMFLMFVWGIMAIIFIQHFKETEYLPIGFMFLASIIMFCHYDAR